MAVYNKNGKVIKSAWKDNSVRNEGWNAHDNGEQKSDCPYKKGTKEYEEWVDGWEAAYQEVNSSRRIVSEVDKDGARELALFAENTPEIYNGVLTSVVKNLQKKARKGIYDKNKAVVAWLHVIDEAARLYDNWNGSGRNSLRLFDKATRMEAARQLMSRMEEDVFQDVEIKSSLENSNDKTLFSKSLNQLSNENVSEVDFNVLGVPYVLMLNTSNSMHEDEIIIVNYDTGAIDIVQKEDYDLPLYQLMGQDFLIDFEPTDTEITKVDYNQIESSKKRKPKTADERAKDEGADITCSRKQIKSSYPENDKQNRFNWAFNTSYRSANSISPERREVFYESIDWYNKNKDKPWMKEYCEEYACTPMLDGEKYAFRMALEELGEINQWGQPLNSSRKSIKSSFDYYDGFENDVAFYGDRYSDEDDIVELVAGAIEEDGHPTESPEEFDSLMRAVHEELKRQGYFKAPWVNSSRVIKSSYLEPLIVIKDPKTNKYYSHKWVPVEYNFSVGDTIYDNEILDVDLSNGSTERVIFLSDDINDATKFISVADARNWPFQGDLYICEQQPLMGVKLDTIRPFTKEDWISIAEKEEPRFKEQALEGIDSSRQIKSAVDGGWEVDSSDVPKALDMWVEYVGEENALEDIAKAMGNDTLNENIEWIAQQWGFGEDLEDIESAWDKYEHAKEVMGVEELFNNLTQAAGYDELAEDLAFIFRQNDFREWDERNGVYSNKINSSRVIKSGMGENGFGYFKIGDYAKENNLDPNELLDMVNRYGSHLTLEDEKFIDELDWCKYHINQKHNVSSSRINSSKEDKADEDGPHMKFKTLDEDTKFELREQIEDELEALLDKLNVKFTTDVWEETVQYILSFFEEDNAYNPRTAKQAVHEWYLDTKDDFPEMFDNKKQKVASARYCEWIRSKRLIKSAKKFFK